MQEQVKASKAGHHESTLQGGHSTRLDAFQVTELEVRGRVHSKSASATHVSFHLKPNEGAFWHDVAPYLCRKSRYGAELQKHPQNDLVEFAGELAGGKER